MGKLWRFSAAVSVATLAGSLGCSSGSWLSNPLSLGKSRSETNLAAAPSFNKDYSELAATQRDRKVASGFGLDEEVEPGAMQRFSKSMTDNSVTKGIKSAWNKTSKSTSGLLTTRKGPEPNSISVFNEVEELDAAFMVSMAKLEESKGNIDGAVKNFNQALKLDPSHQAALLGLARIHDGQGNLTKATAYYRQAVKAHPKDAAAHNDLGLCYARQNRLQEAVESLERATKLAPEKALYRNNIATEFVEMGYPDAALAHLKAAHGDAIAHYNLGCLLYDRGEAGQSLEHFALAYEKDRQLTAAYEWAVAVQQELDPTANAALAQNPPAQQQAVTASDNRFASQAPARNAPSLTPSWASDADRSSQPAAAPSPDSANGYAPAEPDPAAMGASNADATYRLPPVDTAYRAPSRY